MDFTSLKSIRNLNWRGCNNFNLSFFEQTNQSQKSNKLLCYGHNGSGKSSIGEAINIIKNAIINEELTSIEDIEIETVIDNRASIEKIDMYHKKDKLKDIHVFNENFIKDNIELSDNKDLNAIVMFGHDVKNNREKEELEEKIENLKNDNTNIEDRIKIIDKEIRSIIEKDFEKKYIIPIRDLKRSRNYTRAIQDYENNYNQKSNVKQLERDIDTEFNELNKLKNLKTSEKVNFNVNNIPTFNIEIGKVVKELQQPNLSKREEEIIELIRKKEGYTNWVRTGSSYIQSTGDNCPLCLQKINQDSILNKISEIINPSVKQITNDLKVAKTNIENYRIKINLLVEQKNGLREFLYINESMNELINKFTDQLNNINNILDQLFKILNKRLDNAYENIDFQDMNKISSKINTHEKNLNNIKNSISTIIEDYNNQINDAEKEIKKSKENLESKVFNLGSIKISKFKKEKLRLIEKRSSNYLEIEQDGKTLREIKQKLRNSSHSLKLMNRDLSFIFTHDKRLELKWDKEDQYKYKVYTNGKPVSKKDLSTGERNALSIVYFFKSLYANKSIKNFDKDSLFIVLDDPVSSMDENNIVGLISYINSEVEKIINSNKKSRVMLMTHRWYVLDSFYKLMGKGEKGKLCFTIERNNDEISQKFLKNNDFIMKNGYKNLLDIVFNYAKSGSEQYIASIGNISRRVIEAYFTFNYRVGLTNLNNKKELFDKIQGNKQFVDDFRKRAIRLILNTESHLEDQSYQFGNEFEEITFSKTEKQQMCRCIIGLLYLLDELHLKQVLKGNYDNWNDVKKLIDGWITYEEKPKQKALQNQVNMMI